MWRAFNTILKRKDRLDFHPYIADAALDTSESYLP